MAIVRVVCWALGHHSEPVHLRRYPADGPPSAVIRTARCARCGRWQVTERP